MTHRTDPDAAFGAPIIVAGIEEPMSLEGRTSVADDRRQAVFSSNRGAAGFYELFMVRRDLPSDPWGAPEPLPMVGVPMVDNFDGVLAPHGLRFYWAPQSPGEGQHIHVASRPDIDGELVGEGVLGELFGLEESEPAVTADGRTIVYIAYSDVSSDLMFATRADWRVPFGAPMQVPGSFLDAGHEAESTVSPDGCEVILRRSGMAHYLVYEAL